MAGHYLVLKSDFMKKKLLIICCILLAGQFAFSQEKETEAIVQKSLDAYNALDIDAFMALFSEDIEMYNFHEPELRAKGLDEVRAVYKRMFDASPNLHSKIVNRIVFDNKVIDHEYITGAYGKEEPFELVFIYEIKDGKIFRTTAIRK